MSARIARKEEIFDALGNPVRRKILMLLQEKERTVGDLAKVLPVSRPAVSRHLRLLSEAGLVAHTDRGTENIYSIEPQGFTDAKKWLDRFWGDALGRFKLLAENTRPKKCDR